MTVDMEEQPIEMEDKEFMTLERYIEKYEHLYKRKVVNPFAKLDLRYFNRDGTHNEALERIVQDVKKVWYGLAPGFDIIEMYLIGDHVRNNVREDQSDIDIAIRCDCSPEDAEVLRKKMQDEILGKGTGRYQKLKEKYKGGKRDFVQIHVHFVKPHGVVYDLLNKEWITYGKTKQAYDKFLFNVFGGNPEMLK